MKFYLSSFGRCVSLSLVCFLGTSVSAQVKNLGDRAWSAPTELSEIRRKSFDPSIIFDSKGNAVTVWIEESAGDFRTSLYSSSLPASGLSWTKRTPVRPEESLTAVLAPDLTFESRTTYSYDLAISEKDEIVVVWSEKNAIYASFSKVDTGWSKPLALASSDTNELGQPRVEFSRNEAVVVWYSKNQTNIEAHSIQIDALTKSLGAVQVLSAKGIPEQTSFHEAMGRSYVELEKLSEDVLIAGWPDGTALHYALRKSLKGWAESVVIPKAKVTNFTIVKLSDDTAKVIYMGADSFGQQSLLARDVAETSFSEALELEAAPEEVMGFHVHRDIGGRMFVMYKSGDDFPVMYRTIFSNDAWSNPVEIGRWPVKNALFASNSNSEILQVISMNSITPSWLNPETETWEYAYDTSLSLNSDTYGYPSGMLRMSAVMNNKRAIVVADNRFDEVITAFITDY